MSTNATKPIAILEYDVDNVPAYFAEFLRSKKIPYERLRVDRGEPAPASIAAYSGLCLMGGSPSANDNLPWISQVLTLTLDAIARDIPVIGHCLGGQLLSKALGGTVTDSPEPEIGWGNCQVEDNAAARAWFGDVQAFPAYQWHFESFSIPDNATRVLRAVNCPNQAFVIGPHIGFQPHIEVDERVIRVWAEKDRLMLKNLRGVGVQTCERMFADLQLNLAAMRAITERVYAVWLAQVMERQAGTTPATANTS
jgi:GMP synthase-like glutamine amidotransferase